MGQTMRVLSSLTCVLVTLCVVNSVSADDTSSPPASKAPRFVAGAGAEALFNKRNLAAFSGSLHAAFALVDHLRVGLAASRSLGFVEGMEGCSTTAFCYHTLYAVGPLVEYHFDPGTVVDAWFGLQLGYEWATGRASDVTQDSTKETYIASPQVGIDWQPNRSPVILGVTGGLSISPGAMGPFLGARLGFQIW